MASGTRDRTLRSSFPWSYQRVVPLAATAPSSLTSQSCIRTIVRFVLADLHHVQRDDMRYELEIGFLGDEGRRKA